MRQIHMENGGVVAKNNISGMNLAKGWVLIAQKFHWSQYFTKDLAWNGYISNVHMLVLGSKSTDENLALVWPELSCAPEPSLQYWLVLLFQKASRRLVLTGLGNELFLNIKLFCKEKLTFTTIPAYLEIKKGKTSWVYAVCQILH